MPYLDGLRGIAIALVLLFHAYARWPNLYAYGDEFVGYKWLNTGSAGVHLFFVISGFVILMSLEKAETFTSFLYRRWIRLFPAMLVCTILIVSTAPLFANRPNGDIGHFDWLPGLTLIGDEAWRSLLGPNVKDIEGAFWSLYVEVYFYVIFGLSFFLVGRRRSLYVLLVLYSLFRV
ncbi:MAG: acyltransferase, partial [Hyphomicrobiales bacterium]|nr:acyltransferase [Hyphomicrobiales bacterium]